MTGNLQSRIVTVNSFTTRRGWTEVVADDGFKVTLPPNKLSGDPLKGTSYSVRYSTKDGAYGPQNYAVEVTPVQGSNAPPQAPAIKSVSPQPQFPGTPPPIAAQPVGASRYTDEDKKAFKKKDDVMVRMNAMNNACQMTRAFASLCAAQPAPEFSFSSREELEAALDVLRVKWFRQLEIELGRDLG